MILRFIKFILIFIILTLSAFLCFALLLIPYVGRKIMIFLRYYWYKLIIVILSIEVKVYGEKPNYPSLIVSNHISWHDIIVYGSITNSIFLSKAEVGEWAIIGYLAKANDTLFIKRGKGEYNTIKKRILQVLLDKRSIIIFPEGTTTDGTHVRKFFPRLFEPISQSKAVLVPSAIHYSFQGNYDHNPMAFITKQLTFIKHLWTTLGLKGIKAHVCFGEPIPSSNDIKNISHKAHLSTTNMLSKLKTQSATNIYKWT